MLRGVRTCLLNDATCYSGHHLASADASGRRVLDVMVANERHIVGVLLASHNGAPASDDISCACINH
jgi:hypothetical protein